MRFQIVFIVVVIALAWAAVFFGYTEMFWVRMLGVLLGFFGFLFAFMLSDSLGDVTIVFGLDLIVISIGLMVIWV